MDGTTLTWEKIYAINFTENNKKIYVSLHYNGANSYLLVDGTEVIRFKAKNSEINANPLCLEYFSKDVSTGNMKKNGLSGYAYDFRVEYDAIAVDDMIGSQKYLMKKNGIV